MRTPGPSGWTSKFFSKRPGRSSLPTARIKFSGPLLGFMIRVGLIGYGYWGPVVARNFEATEGCQLAAICDTKANAQGRARKAHPGVLITGDPAEVVGSPDIDAVAVITPVWTHFEFAKAALENGKHVF